MFQGKLEGFFFCLRNRYEGDAMLDNIKETWFEVRGTRTVSLRHLGLCQLNRDENNNKIHENRVSVTK